MGRLPLFDRSACLDSATFQFWRDGYAASSIDDLCRCTGLARASVYHAFADKRGLLLACLERYAATSATALADYLRRPGSGRDALIAMLDGSAADAAASEHPPGCFFLVVGSEMGSTDVEVAARVQAGIAEIQHTLTLLAFRGIGDGSLPRQMDAIRAANILTGIVVGIRSLGRLGGAAPIAGDLLLHGKRVLDSAYY